MRYIFVAVFFGLSHALSALEAEKLLKQFPLDGTQSVVVTRHEKRLSPTSLLEINRCFLQKATGQEEFDSVEVGSSDLLSSEYQDFEFWDAVVVQHRIYYLIQEARKLYLGMAAFDPSGGIQHGTRTLVPVRGPWLKTAKFSIGEHSTEFEVEDINHVVQRFAFGPDQPLKTLWEVWRRKGMQGSIALSGSDRLYLQKVTEKEIPWLTPPAKDPRTSGSSQSEPVVTATYSLVLGSGTQMTSVRELTFKELPSSVAGYPTRLLSATSIGGKLYYLARFQGVARIGSLELSKAGKIPPNEFPLPIPGLNILGAEFTPAEGGVAVVVYCQDAVRKEYLLDPKGMPVEKKP